MSTPAPDTVKRLVDRFDRDRKVFLPPDYKEEQLRASSGPSPSIRHSHFVIRTFLGLPVIHEESIKACPELGRRVAGATKAPDFRDAADGSQLAAHSPRLSDSDLGRSAASRWPSPASVLSPHSSILSSDILAQVYEQFLGKVTRLTAGHQAKVEGKPKGLLHARAFDFPTSTFHDVGVEQEPPALLRTG